MLPAPRPFRCLLAAALLAIAGPGLAAQSNVLVIMADDLGVDRVGAYAEHPNPGRTPNIDKLARRGLLFRNAWANPTGAPSRAGMLTGRHPFRHGLGGPLVGSELLTPAEITIPEVLSAAPDDWTSVVIGKWGLGGPETPALAGFDHHVGSIGNLQPGSYYNWNKYTDGVAEVSTQYATSAASMDAERVLLQIPEPWFCWLSFNAPHKPYHAPPDHLHTFNLSTGSPTTTPVKFMKAMVEAMDTEIGRLLAALPEELVRRTTIIFVGDNGTDFSVATPPVQHSKGTIFEGGINVPLIVRSPFVRAPGSESDGLVHVNDIFATVADLAHVDLSAVLPPDYKLDSKSLFPYFRFPNRPTLRRYLYSGGFTPNGAGLEGPWETNDRAMRNERYKLVRRQFVLQGPQGPIINNTTEIYDLWVDPTELDDLLQQDPVPGEANIFRSQLMNQLDRLYSTEN